MAKTRSRIFRFESVEVREDDFLLIRAAGAVAVEPTAFRVLLFLLNNPHRLLKKEEIVSAVWSGYAVSDNSLTRSVATLRRLLDDDAKEPRYIQTVPTIGYRFIASVETLDDPIEDRRDENREPFSEEFSLAILPFRSIDVPAEFDYLSEGMSDNVINLLSRIPGLRVVPRTSTSRYRGDDVDIKKVARTLGVPAVVTGTVSLRENMLSLQAELVDVGKNAQKWGEAYRRPFDEIFEVQRDLARQICLSLRPQLSLNEEGLLASRPTENREAYLLYLKTMHFGNKLTPDGIRKGLDYCRQAIDTDPVFGRAYFALAYIYVLMGSLGALPPSQAFPRAKAAAIKALEIDGTLADAHSALAYVYLAYDWDFPAAEKECLKALALAPRLAQAHFVYSQWLLINRQPMEAAREARIALDLDPLSVANYHNLAMVYHLSEREDLAVELWLLAVDLEPSFSPAHQLLAVAYANGGKREEALHEMSKAFALAADPRSAMRARSVSGIMHAILGDESEARAILSVLMDECQPPDYLPAHDCASIYALLGEVDGAFECLYKAVEGRAINLAFIGVRPMLRSLHSDPRFAKLLNKMTSERGPV